MAHCSRCEVESLIIEYAACSDSGDLEGLSRLFTHDAVFEVEGPDGALQVWDGADTIMERLADALTGAQQLHFMSNIRLRDEDATGITVESRLVLVGIPAGEPPQLRLTGTYVDRVVERDGVLRFQRRHVTVR